MMLKNECMTFKRLFNFCYEVFAIEKAEQSKIEKHLKQHNLHFFLKFPKYQLFINTIKLSSDPRTQTVSFNLLRSTDMKMRIFIFSTMLLIQVVIFFLYLHIYFIFYNYLFRIP